MLRKNLLISFGSPIIDIKVRVNKEFLQKHNLNENETVSLQNYKNKRKKNDKNDVFNEIETVFNDFEKTIKIGGSVTTTAIICQELLKNPQTVCYFGAIGNDFNGELIKNQLESVNINFFGELIDKKTTGKCAVLLTDSNRTLITDLGASKLLSKDFLTVNHQVLKEGKFFYVSAFFLEISKEIFENLLEFIEIERKILIFNLGAAFLCEKHSDFIKSILKSIDVLIGNQKEFFALLKILNLNKSDLENTLNNDVFKYLRENVFKKTAIIIVTNGPLDVTASTMSVTFKTSVHSAVKFETHLNLDDLDTNGAGDAFVGGFLASFIQENDLKVCIEEGIKSSRGYIYKNSLSNLKR